MPWTKNTGVIPCERGLIVEVRTADGDTDVGLAEGWIWSLDGPVDGVITEWRVFGATEPDAEEDLRARRDAEAEQRAAMRAARAAERRAALDQRVS
jgi:hypothetical protein